MAIGIKVKKAPKKYYLGASKFFGSPTIPLSWKNDFSNDQIFLCQINLEDIAHLDKSNELPPHGYLYIFLHTIDGYYNLKADVRYFDGEPELALHDFNAMVKNYQNFNDAYLMEFYQADNDATCTRLLGEPSDWNYENNPPKLFLQFDPLDSDMGFLDFLDGFIYFFFDKNKKDFNKIFIHEEFS